MKTLAVLLLFISSLCRGQDAFHQLLAKEHAKGRFNGSALIVKNGKVISRVHKGFANFQFQVPITSATRFPIASVTKLFTALVILQLQEKAALDLHDPLGKYIDSLPENCRQIRIIDLLLHQSGLSNEPIKAYLSPYGVDAYIHTFVSRKTVSDSAFNYNNVDYILLSKIIEKRTQSPFSQAIYNQLLSPLQMTQTGSANEELVIPHLAYGYHNYSFGTGHPRDTLYNDQRFISNYYGAGHLYATPDDLLKLLTGLKENKLLSRQTKTNYICKPQRAFQVNWLKGSPTIGFFFDQKSFRLPVLRRSGNIDGFNAEIITDLNFENIIIVLCNTDTADLSSLGDQLYKLLN